MEFARQDQLSGAEIKVIRARLGLTQKTFAELLNVSKKSVERWEQGTDGVSGPVTTLLKLFKEHPELVEELEVPEQEFPLRLRYMDGDDLCTIIDVDDRRRRIRIKNYTTDYISRAFGNNMTPTYEDYENFLRSRCFPETRDKMKLILRELNLPFYDPFLIIQKTAGRMAEDNYWIKIERKRG